MDLYDTIFVRRTVKKFAMTPLGKEDLEDIRQYVSGIRQLPGCTARFQSAAAGEVSDRSAPHYLLAFCEGAEPEYANVGYVLAKAELYIQSKGLGTHWIAMAKPTGPRENFCILLAFGKTDEPFRKGIEDFKRLPLSRICSVENAVVRAARLAPSAMNEQPWKIEYTDPKITVRPAGRGVVNALLPKKWSRIDIGIITQYLEVALEHEGRLDIAVQAKGKDRAFRTEILPGS